MSRRYAQTADRPVSDVTENTGVYVNCINSTKRNVAPKNDE